MLDSKIIPRDLDSTHLKKGKVAGEIFTSVGVQIHDGFGQDWGLGFDEFCFEVWENLKARVG